MSGRSVSAEGTCRFCLERSRIELDRLDSAARVLLLGEAPDEFSVPSTLACSRIPAAAGPGDLDGCGRYELAVVFGLGDSADGASVTRLLGRLRDLHANRALVCAGCLPDIGFAEMLGLGFERHVDEDGRAAVYLYDRDRYNEKRDWNSPDNWANPDNFERYRW